MLNSKIYLFTNQVQKVEAGENDQGAMAGKVVGKAVQVFIYISISKTKPFLCFLLLMINWIKVK